MLAAYIHDELTPFTFEQAAKALEAAMRAKLGYMPSREALALTLAKTALETGRWKKIHCFNWGNIKAGQKWSGMYTCILLNEVLKGKVVWFAPEGQLAGGPGTSLVGQRSVVPAKGSPDAEWPAEPPLGYGHPQTRMRAYANKYDGAYDYVDFISQGRYASAMPYLLSGDAAQWVHTLKKLGYFTADEATYLKGVASLQREFVGRLNGLPVEPIELPEAEYDNAALLLALHRALVDLDDVLTDDRDRNLRTEDT